jgi:hypothetical protein
MQSPLTLMPILERAWSPNKYEHWLADLLIREFLGDK